VRPRSTNSSCRTWHKQNSSKRRTRGELCTCMERFKLVCCYIKYRPLQNAFTTELPPVLLICYTWCSCTNKVMIAAWLAAVEQFFSFSDMNCGLSFHNMWKTFCWDVFLVIICTAVTSAFPVITIQKTTLTPLHFLNAVNWFKWTSLFGEFDCTLHEENWWSLNIFLSFLEYLTHKCFLYASFPKSCAFHQVSKLDVFKKLFLNVEWFIGFGK
jgi:hypothetical protein